MTIRCSTKLIALLFCLPLGLCVAGTAWAGSDDDDEEWHDTTGKKDEKSSDKDSDKDSSKSAHKDSSDKDSDDKKADKDSAKESDKDAKDSGQAGSDERPKKHKHKHHGGSSSTKVSLALLGSYGFRDPLAPGLGLRAGAHIEGVLPFYFGAVGEYFFGTTRVKKSATFGDTDNVRRFVYFGGEAGVDVEATSDFLIRPFMGLGLGLDTNKQCDEGQPCQGDSTLHLTITPGIVGMYQMGSIFVGLDLRYLIIPGASVTSGPVVSATIGLTF